MFSHPKMTSEINIHAIFNMYSTRYTVCQHYITVHFLSIIMSILMENLEEHRSSGLFNFFHGSWLFDKWMISIKIRQKFHILHSFSCRVTPALVREASYSSIRIGAYEPIKRLFGATDPAHTPLYKKIASGATSGMISRTSWFYASDLSKHQAWKYCWAVYRKIMTGLTGS